MHKKLILIFTLLFISNSYSNNISSKKKITELEKQLEKAKQKVYYRSPISVPYEPLVFELSDIQESKIIKTRFAIFLGCYFTSLTPGQKIRCGKRLAKGTGKTVTRKKAETI